MTIWEDVVLDDEAKALLRALVAVERRQGRGYRFEIANLDQGTPIWIGPLSPGGEPPAGEVFSLGQLGLVSLDESYRDRGRIRFWLAPKGRRYVAEVMEGPQRDPAALQEILRLSVEVRTAIERVELTDENERETVRLLLLGALAALEDDARRAGATDEEWAEARRRMPERLIVLKNAAESLRELARWSPVATAAWILVEKTQAVFGG